MRNQTTFSSGSWVTELFFVFILMLPLALLVSSCGAPDSGSSGAGASGTGASGSDTKGTFVLSNPEATPKAKALARNLEHVRHEAILFGHQDDLAYGVEWLDEPGRSDVKEVSGSYPALYGWEIGHIEHGAEKNLDNVSFDKMREWIREGYERGGVIAISWHSDHPSGGSSWDVKDLDRPIAQVLPGGEHHNQFVEWMDRTADFLESLTAVDSDGQEYGIPVIFRPWHEMSGSFFWWGDAFGTHEEYRDLYRMTVEHFRDKRGLHHLIWAYSPNSISEFEREEYWNWYPGDEYVDLIGFDDYYTTWGGYGDEDGVARMASHLGWLVNAAEQRGKIPALTETGEKDGLRTDDWYTGQLLAAIKGHPDAKRIAYLLVWRNANRATDRPDHFYAPYPGHSTAEDFMTFVNDPLIWLEDDLPPMYE